MTERLLPYVKNPEIEGHIYHAAWFILDKNMPEDLGEQLRVGIDSITRTQADLIVLDINHGEPAWLKTVLDRFVGFGAPVIVHPPKAARPETLEAALMAQASNTWVIANNLGYSQPRKPRKVGSTE